VLRYHCSEFKSSFQARVRQLLVFLHCRAMEKIDP
jgi:hypothetical protein